MLIYMATLPLAPGSGYDDTSAWMAGKSSITETLTPMFSINKNISCSLICQRKMTRSRYFLWIQLGGRCEKSND